MPIRLIQFQIKLYLYCEQVNKLRVEMKSLVVFVMIASSAFAANLPENR